MKKTLAILAVLLAAQAYAGTAWVNVAERKVNWYQHPQIVQVEGRTVSLAPTLTPSSLAYLAAAGWTAIEYDCHPTDAVLDYDAVPPIRCMTPAELEAREAARLEAEAQAEALRGPAPEVFVPMLDSDGELVGTARIVVIEGSLAVVASTNSASPQKTWAEQKNQILAQLDSVAESRASAAAARIAVKQTVLAGELPEEDLAQIVDLWPAWSAGVSHAVDEIVRHEGSLYKVVQAHTSQPDWPPPDVPSLFAEITPPGLIAEWVQPTGAHDTYSLGDLVTHVGQTWESTVDNNSWEPGVYGWKIEPGE